MSKRSGKLVRVARLLIVDALETDLSGEGIIKEVWEQCEDDDDLDAVEKEIRAIIAMIRKRGA